jgi:hypothetical protein
MLSFVRSNLIKTRQSLANLLPPKKADLEPRPAIVDDAEFEVADPTEVRLFPLVWPFSADASTAVRRRWRGRMGGR